MAVSYTNNYKYLHVVSTCPNVVNCFDLLYVTFGTICGSYTDLMFVGVTIDFYLVIYFGHYVAITRDFGYRGLGYFTTLVAGGFLFTQLNTYYLFNGRLETTCVDAKVRERRFGVAIYIYFGGYLDNEP